MTDQFDFEAFKQAAIKGLCRCGQVVLTPQLEQKVLSLYGMGSSYSDISQHLSEMYGYAPSDSELTAITDKVIPAMRDWQNRPLESLYVLVWLDGIYYKVRHEGRVVTRVLYSVIGLTLLGKKQVLDGPPPRYLYR